MGLFLAIHELHTYDPEAFVVAWAAGAGSRIRCLKHWVSGNAIALLVEAPDEDSLRAYGSCHCTHEAVRAGTAPVVLRDDQFSPMSAASNTISRRDPAGSALAALPCARPTGCWAPRGVVHSGVLDVLADGALITSVPACGFRALRKPAHE